MAEINTGPDPEQRTEPLPAEGHVVPLGIWKQVVADADRIRAAHEEQLAAEDEDGERRRSAVSPVLTLPNTVKAWPQSGRPTQLFVQHTGETPLAGGYAESLTRASNNDPNWQASWHSFVDPIRRVRQVPWNLGAWTQGAANQFAIGMECSGYAAYTPAQWATPAGDQQLENLAHEWIYYWQIEKSLGNTIELRWLDTDEVRAVLNGNRTIKGFCIHAQIEPANRTDAGAGFPYGPLMARIRQLAGATPAPAPKPTPTPAPTEEITVAEADRIIKHINALALGGYTWKGKKHAGFALVGEETQRNARAIPSSPVSRGGKNVAWKQDTADGTSAIVRVEAKLAALTALVAKQQNLTEAQVAAIVEEETRGVFALYYGEPADPNEEPVVFPITDGGPRGLDDDDEGPRDLLADVPDDVPALDAEDPAPEEDQK